LLLFNLTINGRPEAVEIDADTPLLWLLREELHLTGTKFGCGVGQCGACTVIVNGEAVRSCILPVDAVGNGIIETIEGITATPLGQKLVEAWALHQVPQCGYCQSGQLIAAAAMLRQGKDLKIDLELIKSTISNLCRCGTYEQIHKAVLSVAHRR
jgi:isoquinoline 1-oxidoreductase alpha subunit